MESPRLTRALQMISLLKSGEAATAGQLAVLFNCSRRTVYRDIKLLRESGLDIRFDDSVGGYVSEKSDDPLDESAAGPLRAAPGGPLDEDELAVILVAAYFSSLAEAEGATRTASIRDSVDQFAGQLSAGVRQRYHRLRQSLVFDSAELPPLSTELQRPFKALLRAVGKRQEVRLELRRGEVRESDFAPYLLRATDGRWQLVGRCANRGAVVDLDLDQIHSVAPTGATYDIPSEYVAPTGDSSRGGPSRGAVPPPHRAPPHPTPARSGDSGENGDAAERADP